MSIQDDVIAEALTWERTPYHDHAAIKGAGVDCIMFIVEVLRAVTKVDVLVPEYSRQHHVHHDDNQYLKHVLMYCDEVQEPQKADIVLFKTGRTDGHAGLVMEWPMIIHSVIGVGVRRAEVFPDTALGKRVSGFYRPRAYANV